MGRFTKIPQNTFEALQLDAGVLLTTFNPASPNMQDEDIICATTGGISITCTPNFSDFGDDVDNVPPNMKELKHLDGWETGISTTGLHTTPKAIRTSLGCADIDDNDGTRIIPRAKLSQDDFKDIWWVGDKANGGFVAVKLMNALSTGGFSLQTTKNGKGTVALDITGHVSINAQDVVPMEFYSIDEEVVIEYVYTAVSPVGTENPREEGWFVLVGDEYKATSDTTVDSNVTYYERSNA